MIFFFKRDAQIEWERAQQQLVQKSRDYLKARDSSLKLECSQQANRKQSKIEKMRQVEEETMIKVFF